MKLHKYSLLLATALAFASCSDINEQYLEGSDQTKEQLEGTISNVPDRANSLFSGMYTMMAQPKFIFTTRPRDDEFGIVTGLLSADFEGADMSGADNGYNWFSVASELASRDATYANPYIRYKVPYMQIGVANDVIAAFPADTKNPKIIAMIAQARAMRAFDYLQLVPYFQFGYAVAKDQPAVPIVGAGTINNNPRATVEKCYEIMLEDLNYAIENLKEFDRGANKFQIDQKVAYGLRARVYLNMGKFAEAAADADMAMQGYAPASVADVSKPAFCDLAEKNWMWGAQITEALAEIRPYATPASWLSAFSGQGYAAATVGNLAMINVLLYNKIPATDVRKGWWLNESVESPLLNGLVWKYTDKDETVEVSGQEIALVNIPNVKVPYTPYMNVKFGMKKGVGSTVNANDYPLMRVEEMILIKAEGLARSGKEAEARQVLEDFVKTYRDPAYTIPANRALTDEIWFQRRVELWGEGFFTSDAKRMGKPIVRFHEGVESNFPEKFTFNIAANDPWLNMRFPRQEMDQNAGIVNNEGGSVPVSKQNPGLRDGVTD
ncbi:RagB/SusD family nutrient uptake outer membrane protein [Alloprevotella sp. OH1205_COT-284]|uniref:RagB/SusD family nutrient uptake outer membrane protein n=1 Tax=Alloprevotella sp. OH1205_COT-284 TaxID=2491043 RepID=UPI000F5EB362|nr:RagB/SusD family nutrient uptake outer membrane protein [Alloprevotella sp. OH1205_COT-284]RRD80264.1 RagB/SusD family nutrient uptake outer membrane protein [Alloprevotella sp. OH1205_COT-284]